MLLNIVYTWLIVGVCLLAALMTFYDDAAATDNRLVWMTAFAVLWPLIAIAVAAAGLVLVLTSLIPRLGGWRKDG
jgi:hypothetical protein